MMGYGLSVKTPAAALPISAQDMIDHLRLPEGQTDHNAWFAGAIPAAAATFEEWTARTLIDTTYAMTVDTFPAVILLPRSPAHTVEQIQYIDADGNAQTLDTAVYELVPDREPAQIRLKRDQTWPAGTHVVVTFTAGHGSEPSSVPPNAAHVLRLLVAQWFEYRESDRQSEAFAGARDLPWGIMRLLQQQQVGEEFARYG